MEEVGWNLEHVLVVRDSSAFAAVFKNTDLLSKCPCGTDRKYTIMLMDGVPVSGGLCENCLAEVMKKMGR